MENHGKFSKIPLQTSSCFGLLIFSVWFPSVVLTGLTSEQSKALPTTGGSGEPFTRFSFANPLPLAITFFAQVGQHTLSMAVHLRTHTPGPSAVGLPVCTALEWCE